MWNSAPFDPAVTEHLAITLAHFLWQGALIGTLAALIARVFQGRPQFRYGIYLSGMLLMAVSLPVTYALVSSASPSTGDGRHELRGPADAAELVDSEREFVTPGAASISPPSDLSGESEAQAIADTPRLESSREAISFPSVTAPADASARSFLQILSPYIVAAYLIGISLMLLRVSVSLYGGHRMRRDAEAIHDNLLLAVIHRAAAGIGLRRVPLVAISKRVPGPVVIGILRPVVLLPLSLTTGLAPIELESLLTHEFAHLRRFDHWALMLQRVVEALLFFHPAVWYVSRRLSVERENCCDDAVIAAGTPRLAYTEMLLKLAEQRIFGRQSSTSLAAAGDRPSRLRERVARLLDPPLEPAFRLDRFWAFGLVLVLAAMVILPAVSFGLVGPPTENEEQRATQKSGQELAVGKVRENEKVKNQEKPGPPKQIAKITRQEKLPIVWGEPKDGLVVGIGEVSTSLKSPARPTITAYLENRGQEPISGFIIASRTSFVLELDGEFYAESDFGGPSSFLPPGKRIGPITIGTDYFHKVKNLEAAGIVEQNTPGPDLTDGEHTLRLHYRYVGEEGDRMRLSSSTVKFKVSLSPYPIDEAVAMLAKELKDADPDIRRAAALAAGKLRLAGSRPALQMVLNDEDKIIRRYAAEALGKIGNRGAVDSLRELLKDAEMDVRLAAAESLVALGEPLNTSWVEPVIKSKHPVFQNAIWLVRRHAGKEAVPALIRCLDANDAAVNNYYNYTIVWQIHACGGPDLKYHHDFDNKGTLEQVEENRQVLSKLKALLDKPAIDDAANSPSDAQAALEQTAKEANPATAMREFPTNGPARMTAAFSPDGKRLAIGHATGQITLYDVQAEKLQATLNGHGRRTVRSLSFSAKGDLLASAGSDMTMRVWDLATGREQLSNAYDERVNAVAFSRDGKTVYVGTGYRGGVVYRVDVQQNKSAQVFDERTSTLAAYDAPEIHDLAVSPDDKLLAVGVFRGIVLIDLKTNKELRILPEDESVAFRRCCFSPDGRLVASVGSGITLWDAATGKVLKRLARVWETGAARSIQFSPDGKHFVAGIDGGEAHSSQVAIWKTGEVKPAAVLETKTPSLKDVEFTPNGKQLAACHADGVTLWNFNAALEKHKGTE